MNIAKIEPQTNSEKYFGRVLFSNQNVLIFYLSYFLEEQDWESFYEETIFLLKNNKERCFYIFDSTEPIFPYIIKIEKFIDICKSYDKNVTIITGQNSKTMLDLYESFGANVVFLPLFNFLTFNHLNHNVSFCKENTFEKRYLTLNKTNKRIRELLFEFLNKKDLLKFGEYSFLFKNKTSFLENNKNFDNSDYGNSILEKYNFNKECFLNVVVESVNEDFFMFKDKKIITNFLSEKSLKALFTGLPFIIVGEPYLLSSLKSYGIKTFSNFWDENYDLEENINNRCEKCFSIIEKVCNEKESMLREIYNETENIHKENKSIVASILKNNINIIRSKTNLLLI